MLSDSNPPAPAKLYFILAIGLVAIGFSPILVRLAPNTSPFLLASYRTIFSVILLFPFWLYYGERGNKQTLSEYRTHLLTAFAGVALGLHFICWIASLSYTSVASASVLVTTHPMILIIAERFLFQEKFGYMVWFGVLLSLAGSIFLGWSDQHASEHFVNPILGNSLAFSAAVIFAVYFLAGRTLRQKLEWIDYTFRIYTTAAITCFLFVAYYGFELQGFMEPTGLLIGFGLAAGPQFLGHGAMNYAVKYVSPTLLSTLILAEPLFASTFAYFLFDEIPPFTSFIAMIIILTGIAITWRKK